MRQMPNASKVQEACHHVRIDVRPNKAAGNKLTKLRPHRQSGMSIGHGNNSGIKRLFPEPVSGQKHGLRISVIDDEREHPVQTRQDFSAVPYERLEQYLGVSLCFEGFTQMDQVFTKAWKIVDRPIEDERETSVGSGKRLV